MISCVDLVLSGGRSARRWDVRTPGGAGISVLDHGATLCSVIVPDRHGKLDEVALGLDRFEDYVTSRHFMGPVVGRYANRIAGAAFAIAGRRYALSQNDGPNCLHGGSDGFDRRQWIGEPVSTADGDGICLALTSPDGDQGFPGQVGVEVRYVWTGDNRLIADFRARSTKPTPVNLSHHGYWNLSGFTSGAGIEDQELQLNAAGYLPVGKDRVPVGTIVPVDGSAFDFREPKRLGDDLYREGGEIAILGGYDHCWAIEGSGLRTAAQLYDPLSGRALRVETDQPGIQVYTGNHFDSTVMRRGGLACARHCAVALETQHFPDSPNQPHFPETILRPGQTYRSRTVYHFTTR